MREIPGDSELKSKLAYGFRDQGLFELALTHSSVEGHSHQRLEFLGDAILAAAVSHALYAAHPEWNEGDLSVERSRYVSKPHLARVAQQLGLSAALRVRKEVARSGPVHAQPSILADAVEALVGAVFLDGGIEAAEMFVARHILALEPESESRDAKTRLQEWCQAKKWDLPVYGLLSQSGPQHAPLFAVSCTLKKIGRMTEAQGHSRKEAEQAAAEAMLSQLEARHD